MKHIVLIHLLHRLIIRRPFKYKQAIVVLLQHQGLLREAEFRSVSYNLELIISKLPLMVKSYMDKRNECDIFQLYCKKVTYISATNSAVVPWYTSLIRSRSLDIYQTNFSC